MMKFRSFIFWCHLITAIIIGVVIFIVSVTGVLLAFRPQIMDMVHQKLLHVEVNKEEPLDLEILATRVREEIPNKKINGITVSSDRTSSVTIYFQNARTVYINPYSGQILGEDSPVDDWMEKIEEWHRWLGLTGKLKPIAHNIKGVSNIAFLFLIISGIYLWWPRQWKWPGIKNIIFFNPNAKDKARDWNWHNVIGFWCAPFLVIIVLTGMIMSDKWANNILYRVADKLSPVQDQGNNKKPLYPALQTVNFDTILSEAKARVQVWDSINIRLPQKPQAPITVNILEHPRKNQRSQLSIDSVTGEIKKWEPHAAKTAGHKLRTWVRVLHTGETFGFIGQALMALASLGAVFLVWTGFAMAWRRFFVK